MAKGGTAPTKVERKVTTADGGTLANPPPAKLKAFGGSANDQFNNVLANMVVDTLWCPDWMTPDVREQRVLAALTGLMAFRPRDEVEGMMAAQAVALHQAAMECLRRAMLKDQPSEATAKLRRDAANLSRCMVDMAEAIERRRGKAPQVVRVEKVVVRDGGQAIVGNVGPGASTVPGGGAGNGQRQEPHAPRALEERQPLGRPLDGAALRSPGAGRATVPRAGDA